MKNRFYTKTLASLYAKQGHYDDAKKGFQYLLKKEPGRTDYLDEILRLSKKIKEKKQTDLIDIVSEWVQLLRSHS